ncbi:hypothetical protein J5N97_012829 [Dioscorea zingiberensis]|uniref:Protein SCAR n=1 Tax=Dioscorea zingiberensis TaxID=325984 RepID=A0A9D5HI38_9LILI|nr:hypothetical protein J5N97_012829 [Dioscorea zingiberensis]
MPLVRFEVRNEYGLGDLELYRGPGRKEDSKALLDGVAVSGLVGILRQLGDLAEFAADVFRDLHEQVMATSARGRKMMTRMQRIEAKLPSLEKAVQSQTSHIHFAYVAGTNWHANVRTDESLLLGSDLPQFIMDSYEECHDPPRLYLLDKFDSAGPGACLKRYSDPSYFKRACVTLELAKAEKVQREKKNHRNKRKGARHRRGEVQRHAVSTSPHNTSVRFASPESDGQSYSTENTFISDLRQKAEVASESTSFDSKTRLNYVEEVSNATNPSALPDDLEYDDFSVSKLEIDNCELSASVTHSASRDGAYDDLQQDPLQGKSANGSPPVTWDEKAEISKPTSPRSFDDILVDRVEDSDPLPACYEISNADTEIAKLETAVDQEDILFDIPNVPSSLPGENHFDEVNSETENYMDALNTMESETETDSEYQTKREVRSLPGYSNSAVESRNEQAPEMVSPSSDSSDSDTPFASHDSLRQDADLELHNTVPAESLDNVESTCSNNAIDKDYSESHPDLLRTSNFEVDGSDQSPESSTHPDLLRTNNFEVDGSDQSPESITHPDFLRTSNFEVDGSDQSPELSTPILATELSNGITAGTSEGHTSSSGDALSMPAINFWTNGNLLGVEPSKPPDFSFPSISREEDTPSDTTVTGFYLSSYMVRNKLQKDKVAAKSDTADIPNGENMDRSPNIRSSMDQNKTCNLGQHGDLSGKQSSQERHSGDIFASKATSDLMEVKPFAPGAELPFTSNADPQTSESGQTTMSISSSFSGLAQRFLSSSLQRRVSFPNDELSRPSGNTSSEVRRSKENSVQNWNGESSMEGVSKVSSAHNTTNKMEHGSLKKSLSSSSRYSEQSSPPLEHMKISFRPMNQFETSKLKLDFSNDDLHENYEDIIFPSFQLLPGPTAPSRNDDSDSDDDTFCRSYPYSSEELMSPRSDSNSDLWEQDENDTIKDHEISHRSPSSVASISNYTGFGHMNDYSLDPKNGIMNFNDNDDGISFQSSQIIDLPGLDAVKFQKPQRDEPCGALPVDSEGPVLQSKNELPLPPPLPPMQWRITKGDFGSIEDNNSVITELDDHLDSLQAQRFIDDKREQNATTPKPIPDSMANPDQNQHDNDHKMNGQREANQVAPNKELDEKDFLQQIRNKSFSLRRTVASKPSTGSQPTTNVNVAAILEKANAIRQAFVGSDDGGDDDNWSDG